jgi:hypothetical protein
MAQVPEYQSVPMVAYEAQGICSHMEHTGKIRRSPHGRLASLRSADPRDVRRTSVYHLATCELTRGR